MKISQYLGYILKDFFTAFGGLMVMVAIYLGVYSVGTISASLLCQIILAALAVTFLKYTFANKYELKQKAQLISFSVCFVLADVMILMWLFLFSPGKLVDKNMVLIYFLVILIVKGAVYAMMYVDSKTQAEQLNRKIKEYNNKDNE